MKMIVLAVVADEDDIRSMKEESTGVTYL